MFLKSFDKDMACKIFFPLINSCCISSLESGFLVVIIKELL